MRIGALTFGLFMAAGRVERALAAEPAEAAPAVLRVNAAQRSPHPIPRYITGKFAEHLGSNILNGMDAQILRNPTFADFPFSTGQTTPDGIVTFQFDRERIGQQLRQGASRLGWPQSAIATLVEAREDGLACWWVRVGPRASVQVSPDTGPYGGRAQRIEIRSRGEGIAQWTYLPLHRVRKLQCEVFARSPDLKSLTASLTPPDAKEPCTTAHLAGLSSKWQKLSGTLEVPADLPADTPHRFAITADGPGQLVVARCLLRPADHVGGADPDVVRLLRESRLPILRWPGGNFASGYHWEDGVGPPERRPTRPNYAWGGVEPNLFGTDEFVAFCRAVGCDPMICLNAGNGTPDEAARWVQYCNGRADTPMGARRAANGHPEPYNVRHWEIGNELWGRWQVHWTTAAGYVDRYRQFVEAMQAADPTIQIYACGAPVMWGKAWNDTLIAGTSDRLATCPTGAGPILKTTDHPLVGGSVAPAADPMDVYRDFMAVPGVLEKKWAALQQDMRNAGIQQPRLAVTELQMFAHIGGPGDGPPRLTRENLVTPATQAEALYDVLVYHAAIRLAPFVTMVTHSATVNHGGGLRKERERVYANPCHWAQSTFAGLAGATPVAVEVTSPKQRAPRVIGDLKNVVPQPEYQAIDAVAALDAGGNLLISIVHRGTSGPIDLAVEIDGFKPAATAEVRSLSADVPWAANSLDAPEAVRPADSQIGVQAGKLRLTIKPYTVLRITVRADGQRAG
jgi:alpha-N-arabinofuranosidase